MSDTPSLSKAARYGKPRPKVPAFARYEGTSAWRKYRRRVRAYARFRAGMDGGGQAAPTLAS